MKLPSLPIIALLSLLAAKSHAASVEDYAYNPPVPNNSISGVMLNGKDDTEFLTPIGIVDTLPQQDIEPAAGPESTGYGQDNTQDQNNDFRMFPPEAGTSTVKARDSN